MLTRDTRQGSRQFLLILGIALVVSGAAMLVYIGLFIIDVIADPRSLGLVELIIEESKGGERALSGHLGRTSFQIGMESPLSTLLLLLVLVWLLGALASIVRSVISVGITLIQSAKSED